MLIAAGQPFEVFRTIRDAAGDPTTVDEPTALAVRPVDGLLGGGLLLWQPADQGSQCVVRAVGDGQWAARVPGGLLNALGEIVIEWEWTYEGDTYTARDTLNVTTVPVCSLDDLAALPGNDAKKIATPGRLRAIGVATEQIEEATRETYSPRIATVETWSHRPLDLPHPTAIQAAVQDGQVVDVSAARVDPVTGLWEIPGTAGRPIRLVVVYGFPTPPSSATRAVALLASAAMADGPFDDRGVAVGDEGGMVRLLTAGVGRAMFSIPEVEAFARRRRVPTIA